jgi:hypothetical protein
MEYIPDPSSPTRGMIDHEKYVSSNLPSRFKNKQSSSFIVACPNFMALENASSTPAQISAHARL